MKKRVLITAGSGFIGMHLLNNFKNKYQIFSPTHEELDLTDTSAVESYISKHPVEYVVHTAVVGGSRIEEEVANDLSINLRMFFNIARCHSHFERMIHLGSGAEYDKTRTLKQVREDEFGNHIPKDNYGLYKYICGEYIEKSNLPIINLRLFGIFGPYENYHYRFISNLLYNVLTNKALAVQQDAYFDYIYIDDLIKIIDFFLTREPAYKSYNIGSGQRIRLLTIAEKIKTITGAANSIAVIKKGYSKEYTPDVSRLQEELGTFSYIPIESSIQALYNWYKAHTHYFKNEN